MNDFFDELEKNSIEKNKDIKNIRDKSNRNKISSIIKGLCLATIIVGFIIGLINYTINENISQLFTSWFIYLGCSLGCFALAEIIQILHDIRNKLYSNNK